MNRYLPHIFLTLALAFEIFCIKLTPVLAETFPLDNAEAVVFTLTQNLSGARDFTFSLILGSLAWAVLITIAAVALAIGYLKYRKRPSYIKIFAVLNAICLVLLAHSVHTNVPIASYYKLWTGSDTTIESNDFYTKEYIEPDSVKIEFSEKRNLILIFLESVEYNFQDSANGGTLPQNLIPEITEYIKTEQSFIPGGTQIIGTGWTMADVVAKTCGIPLMFSPRNPVHPTKNGKLIPGATCLTDILHQHGYTTVVSKGADLSFSAMRAFVNTHQVNEGYGRDEYLQRWEINPNVLNEWGVSDSAHYALIKQHIERISAAGKPWAIWTITLNTHMPYGASDPNCHIPDNATNKENILSSIRCTSRQLDKFIQWAKTQEWYDNTTIAVMGDHATMAPKHVIGFLKPQTHYWLNFFIHSARTPMTNKREFTSLDMFPTILEAMGAKIQGDALGLGRSLYSWAPTLIEKYGLDSLNTQLKKHSETYSKFIFHDKERK